MFNLLRLQARPATAALQTARRCYATAFVPPASLKEGLATPLPVEPKLKPDSPTFYTARAGYFDGLTALEDAITDTRRALTALQLLPLPQSVRKALPPLQPVWHTKDTLAGHLSAIVTTSKYRRYIRVLDQLNEYRQIAEIAGVVELAENLADIITSFERENKEAVLAHGKKKPVQFDEYGRSYTLGRRKESTARVWVIPVKTPEAAVSQSALQTESPGELSHFIPQPLTTPTKMLPVTTTNIIVNNTPFIEYLYVTKAFSILIRCTEE
ncbi:hypothetical protein EW026_g3777 [Hermanssonia centrifuga]|uniref:Uncharacterized protein n=1 Tax=Hermanssonia centrifuga TaxID=98765 RepID=A0A4S4KL24_9APHY|nr:hypothetical protein EW026_g3777 [Hermanssonia centrifuga]